MSTAIRYQVSGRASNPETALDTQLNALASLGSATGPAIANTELDTLADVEIALASFTPGATPYVELYLIPSVDGTNYADAPGDFVGARSVSAGASAKRVVFRGIPVPPRTHKWHVVNKTAATLAATGNTVTAYYYRHGSGA